MTVRPLMIIGAGGFGREAADVVFAVNESAASQEWDLLGVYDDAPSPTNVARLRNRGIKVLGPVPTEWDGPSVSYVIGIGDPEVRQAVSSRVDALGWTAATLVHPSAVIGTLSVLEPGTVVCGGVQVSTNVRCGKHVHLNPNCTIGHDAVLTDFVSVNPAATVSGEVTVGKGTLLGAASCVLQGVHLAPGTIVGASACVVRSTEVPSVLVGVPARARASAGPPREAKAMAENQWDGPIRPKAEGRDQK